MKNFHFYILFLILLINIITKETSNDLLVFKFKTYYPTKIDNNSEYNSGDFVNSFISSKAFLELESGNENEFEKGTNQTLRTFVNDKTNIFVFRDYYRKNNISFCDFNASFSSSYKVKMISDQYCESIQTFRINTDIEFKNYFYHDFFIENYFCYNDSLCADVGIDIQSFPISGRQDFLTQLQKIFNSSEQNYCFNYLDKDKEEGFFTFGTMPHNFSKDFTENDMISFYSQTDQFSIQFDTITLDGKEYFKKEQQYDSDVDLEISLEKEGIEFNQYIFDVLKEIFFDEYVEKGICKYINEFTSKIIFCYDSGFGINDIKKFPIIKFVKYNLNFNITFNGEELFYYKDHKYFCKIYCRFNTYKTFVIGRILLKKYLTVFNGDKKQIYFYDKKNKNEEINEKSFLEKYGIIILISAIVLIGIIYLLGILTGKIIYKGRKKVANELEDNYEYKIDKNKKTEPLYNPKEDKE